MARFFFIIPHYIYRFGFRQAVPPKAAGLGPVPFRRFADLIKRQSKSKAKFTRGALTLPFSLSLICRRKTDAKPPDALPRALREVAHRARAPLWSTTARSHPRVGLACPADVVRFTLSSPLVSAVSLARPSHVLCMVTLYQQL